MKWKLRIVYLIFKNKISDNIIMSRPEHPQSEMVKKAELLALAEFHRRHPDVDDPNRFHSFGHPGDMGRAEPTIKLMAETILRGLESAYQVQSSTRARARSRRSAGGAKHRTNKKNKKAGKSRKH